jgi:uncharacterized membrane protein YjgN (DUF898 family)
MMHRPFSIPSIPLEGEAPVPQAISFTGERSEFRKLVTRGAWLELITLGFYRFWLATDIRRHLWSHTEVQGDAAEYTGTAKELFIGFLVAMAILMPVYIGYTLIGLEAERIQAFASFPMLAFFFLFTQFALYRARRYRLTRTVWRGVRFGMGGSGWSFAWRSVLWGVWATLTLGLAWPWRAAALERFKMRHSAYGTLQGSFEGTGWDFFKKGWHLWLLMWVSAIFVVPVPFLYAMYKAVEWRWWVNGLRFGAVRFESDLDVADLMGFYWKVIGWLCLFGIVLSVWFGAVFGIGFATLGGNLTGDQQFAAVMANPLVLAGLGLGYLVTALGFNVVFRVYLMRDLWAKIADTTVVHNIAATDNIAALGEAANALGEGFSDSLDIGGF